MKKNDTLEQKASMATKWSGLTEIISKIISPLTSMLLARLLSPEAFGVVATITMITSFADMFTDAGFQKYIIQSEFIDTKELDENTNVAFWSNLGIALFFLIIIINFSEEIARLVGNKGLGDVVSIAAFSIPLTSFSSIQIARYRRDFHFKILFYIRIIGAILPVIITVPLAFYFRNYWALIIGNIVGKLVIGIILNIKSEWKPKFYYNFKVLKRMFGYSWWILLETISIWLTSYIGTFIIGNYLSSYYLGVYKISMVTVDQLTAIIVASTSAPLFSALSKLKNEHKKFEEIYYKYMEAVGFIIIPMGVGIYMYRSLITNVLLGAQWWEATGFIGLLGLTDSVCLIFGTYNSGVYNAKGQPKFSFLVQILHLIILIPVLYIAAQYGFKTLYVARCFVRFQLVIVHYIIIKVYFNISPIEILVRIKPIIYCTTFMGILILFLKRISLSPLWEFFSIFLCIICYFGSFYYLYKREFKEILYTLGIKNILLEKR